AVIHGVNERTAFALAAFDVFARARRGFEDFDRGGAPGPVGFRDQALREDVAEGLRQPRADDALFVLREQADDAVYRFRRVDRVQRRKHQMAGLGRFERDLGRLEVAHFADEDHFRRLPEGGAQGEREGRGVAAQLALVDRGDAVVVEEFDRVLDGDDVIRLFLIELIDDGGERRGFAGAGRPRHQ